MLNTKKFVTKSKLNVGLNKDIKILSLEDREPQKRIDTTTGETSITDEVLLIRLGNETVSESMSIFLPLREGADPDMDEQPYESKAFARLMAVCNAIAEQTGLTGLGLWEMLEKIKNENIKLKAVVTENYSEKTDKIYRNISFSAKDIELAELASDD